MFYSNTYDVMLTGEWFSSSLDSPVTANSSEAWTLQSLSMSMKLAADLQRYWYISFWNVSYNAVPPSSSPENQPINKTVAMDTYKAVLFGVVRKYFISFTFTRFPSPNVRLISA